MISRKNSGARNNRRVYFNGFKVLAVISLATPLFWFGRGPNPDSRKSSVPQYPVGMVSLTKPSVTFSSFLGTTGVLSSSRPLYPYSVIPGGVQNADELRKAVANDPVIAAHYVGFDFNHLQVVRLAEARSAFVSYRRGNLVYWTSRKVSLPAGETLITDGTHSSRTRCGNQVSDAPRTPIAPAGEPTPETLTTPLVTEDIELPPIDMPLDAPPGGFLLLAGGPGFSPPAVGGGTGGIPPYTPVIVGGGGGGTIPTSIPPEPVPNPTPEPGTLLLIATGFCAACVTRRRCKS